jgi:hypothetical protein
MKPIDLEKLTEDLTDDQARELIKLLAKQRGGEMLDRAIDELIEEGEGLDFPEIIEPRSR